MLPAISEHQLNIKVLSAALPIPFPAPHRVLHFLWNLKWSLPNSCKIIALREMAAAIGHSIPPLTWMTTSISFHNKLWHMEDSNPAQI